MKIFRNKSVVITGAGSGMGRALAMQLGSYGANVVATDIDEEAAQVTAREIKRKDGHASYHPLDVRDRDAFRSLLKGVVGDYGTLDYLFNNAGIAIFGEVRDQSEEDWQRVIDINQMGVLYGTLAAYEIMCRQGSGHIVNTASIAGLSATPLLTPYSMTKHAVVGLSMSLREEAKGLGVKVSTVCPGLIRTSIADGNFARASHFPDAFGFLEEKLRIRPLSADEAAKYILKGVKKNQAQIIFPAHGRSMVNAYRYLAGVNSSVHQLLLKFYRRDYRHQ
ncbi:MAG: SDR family oxidoreductase [Ketobacteraceae bacterium]|nr:SDR family oxidoreductase [Ketobacteraceae bacterium]